MGSVALTFGKCEQAELENLKFNLKFQLEVEVNLNLESFQHPEPVSETRARQC
jgi:hypothetical protein